MNAHRLTLPTSWPAEATAGGQISLHSGAKLGSIGGLGSELSCHLPLEARQYCLAYYGYYEEYLALGPDPQGRLILGQLPHHSKIQGVPVFSIKYLHCALNLLICILHIMSKLM